MDAIWKMVLAFLAVIMIAATGIAITMGNSDVTTAGNYFEEVCGVIAESNYSALVIQECIAEAAENGYTLTVEIHGINKPGTRKYAEAVFSYSYEIPILQVSDKKVKRKII